MNKNAARLRRARKTRAKIADLNKVVCVFRTNNRIYAQVISAEGDNLRKRCCISQRAISTYTSVASA